MVVFDIYSQIAFGVAGIKEVRQIVSGNSEWSSTTLHYHPNLSGTTRILAFAFYHDSRGNQTQPAAALDNKPSHIIFQKR